jgi:hypothetical protein
VALAERNDLGQTLGLDGANESLRVGVQVGASRRCMSSEVLGQSSRSSWRGSRLPLRALAQPSDSAGEMAESAGFELAVRIC